MSASRERQDLRQSGDASLAREAANMVEVKSDIRVVSVEGVEYYLAYAPLKLQGWSFGTLVKKEEAQQHLSEEADDIDAGALVLYAVKTHVRQYLYRNYHGFNTITLTV